MQRFRLYPSEALCMAMNIFTSCGLSRSAYLLIVLSALRVKLIVQSDLLSSFISIRMLSIPFAELWRTVEKGWRVGCNPSLALVIFDFVVFLVLVVCFQGSLCFLSQYFGVRFHLPYRFAS